MNNNEEKKDLTNVEQNNVDQENNTENQEVKNEITVVPDFWDKFANAGRKATKFCKRAGKVVLVVGGVVTLGAIGLAVAKNVQDKKQNQNGDNQNEDNGEILPDDVGSYDEVDNTDDQSNE